MQLYYLAASLYYPLCCGDLLEKQGVMEIMKRVYYQLVMVSALMFLNGCYSDLELDSKDINKMEDVCADIGSWLKHVKLSDLGPFRYRNQSASVQCANHAWIMLEKLPVNSDGHVDYKRSMNGG
jgi:hypothetical protein